ncbi:MAG: hypothetical protein F6K10_01000 [Moorea sp. SIO2B7]|nr:hypothetical protein [Moorena sp. SIO2B7]
MLTSYWEGSQTKQGKTHRTKGNKLYRVAQNQGWHCPLCKEHLFNGKQLYTHHLVKVSDGDKDGE